MMEETLLGVLSSVLTHPKIFVGFSFHAKKQEVAASRESECFYLVGPIPTSMISGAEAFFAACASLHKMPERLRRGMLNWFLPALFLCGPNDADRAVLPLK
jgi:hypothetical protein